MNLFFLVALVVGDEVPLHEQTCFTEEDMVYNGDGSGGTDIRSINDLDAEQCATACWNESECTAFTWVDGVCTLKAYTDTGMGYVTEYREGAVSGGPCDHGDDGSSMEPDEATCVWVNHIYDVPGQLTCECVDPTDPCLVDGMCEHHNACAWTQCTADTLTIRQDMLLYGIQYAKQNGSIRKKLATSDMCQELCLASSECYGFSWRRNGECYIMQADTKHRKRAIVLKGNPDFITGSCQVPPTTTTTTTLPATTIAPQGPWTSIGDCDSSYYEAGDGCDCGCGLWDADCNGDQSSVTLYCYDPVSGDGIEEAGMMCDRATATCVSTAE